jgi:chemotaxis protein MotA
VLLILSGLVVVLISVVSGYLLERGSLLVLMQPAELLIIVGGAVGIVLISGPGRNLRVLSRTVLSARGRRLSTPDTYLEALKVLYVLFHVGRSGGSVAMEPHVETPDESEIFTAHPSVLYDSEATSFICDTFRMALSAGLSGDQVERLMTVDMEVQRSGRQQPLRILVNVADSLPGLGIIAAVLGVVVTMQALGGPALDIGQKVAAALVGTFLGILLCYGVVGPLSHHLECLSKARSEFLQVLRVALTWFFHGASPMVAAEAGRRTIPLDLRPSLDEMERQLRRENIPLTPAQQEALAKREG